MKEKEKIKAVCGVGLNSCMYLYVRIIGQLRQGSSSLMISMFLFLNLVVYFFVSFSLTHVLLILS